MLPLLFQPLRLNLYSFDELFKGFVMSRPGSFAETVDFRIYLQYVAAGRYAPTDYFTAMMEAVHDNAIREATEDYLRSASARAAVAFMGGHDLARNSPVYAAVASLARQLARQGYLPISGGGPGAMEATHLGALHQHSTPAALARALRELGRIPDIPPRLQDIVAADGKIDRRLVAKAHAWLLPAYRIRRRIRQPGESLAIPTWLYGHEPTTALATQIAKYFQNSVREDRLLGVATHGVIYVEGRAGTLQEIFQDAALNCYRILGDFSPMIFFGRRQWLETLPIVPVLKKLFKAGDFERYVRVTDDPGEILTFLAQRRRRESPSERMVRLKPDRDH
jgi:predicted Rossmann-fold nucleotide-binding protein